LQNANKLRVLPPSIGALTAMVRLSLHINQLEHLPPEIGNLVHLEALR
jgi:Leucine-rich repeat (LRR) protein